MSAILLLAKDSINDKLEQGKPTITTSQFTKLQLKTRVFTPKGQVCFLKVVVSTSRKKDSVQEIHSSCNYLFTFYDDEINIGSFNIFDFGFSFNLHRIKNNTPKDSRYKNLGTAMQETMLRLFQPKPYRLLSSEDSAVYHYKMGYRYVKLEGHDGLCNDFLLNKSDKIPYTNTPVYQLTEQRMIEARNSGAYEEFIKLYQEFKRTGSLIDQHRSIFQKNLFIVELKNAIKKREHFVFPNNEMLTDAEIDLISFERLMQIAPPIGNANEIIEQYCIQTKCIDRLSYAGGMILDAKLLSERLKIFQIQESDDIKARQEISKLDSENSLTFLLELGIPKTLELKAETPDRISHDEIDESPKPLLYQMNGSTIIRTVTSPTMDGSSVDKPVMFK